VYVYRLAGDDLELARAELKGFLRSQGVDEEPEFHEGFALTEAEPSQLRRLALVHEVGEVLNLSDSLETDYRPESSYAVRSENVEKKLEKQLGERLETADNTVDLESPDEVVKIYRFEGEYCLARVVENIDRGLFEKRENQKRPFSSPISLDPVLARVMVNISEVPVGGSIIDPFCGTGGVLIEAGLCGIETCGLDIQNEMVEGARENLESYGILNHDIRESDIADAPEMFNRSFDAVVTDLPYGQSSKKEGKPVEKFLENASELTDGKIVFMSDKSELGGMKPEFEIYVHKNLTRYIYIRTGDNL
jgi:tRNA (guanine10-N2)-dimethyltransferase